MSTSSAGGDPFAADPITASARALDGDLQQARLARRVERLEQVLEALRERHHERSRTGPPPAALIQAIDGFTDELAQLTRPPARDGKRPVAP